MVSMDGGGSARDTPTRFEIPIPTTKVVEIHNCWLARAALARQPFFPRDIWSQFTALTHQQRAYTGGKGPDAYKPIDTRSLPLSKHNARLVAREARRELLGLARG